MNTATSFLNSILRRPPGDNLLLGGNLIVVAPPTPPPPPPLVIVAPPTTITQQIASPPPAPQVDFIPLNPSPPGTPVNMAPFNSQFSSFEPLVDLDGQSNFAAWPDVFKSSPTLLALLNRAPDNSIRLNGENEIGTATVLGKNGIPESIRFDPKNLPGNDPEDAFVATRFATLLAHELAHLVVPAAFVDVTTAAAPNEASRIGLRNEGIALYYEYLAATELETRMNSGNEQNIPPDQTFQAALDRLALQDGGISTAEFRTDAIQMAAQWNSTRNPSGVPYLTYAQYYFDVWIASKADDVPRDIDWSRVRPDDFTTTTLEDGTMLVNANNIPRLGGGTENIHGVYAKSWQPILTWTVIDPNDGSGKVSISFDGGGVSITTDNAKLLSHYDGANGFSTDYYTATNPDGSTGQWMLGTPGPGLDTKNFVASQNYTEYKLDGSQYSLTFNEGWNYFIQNPTPNPNLPNGGWYTFYYTPPELSVSTHAALGKTSSSVTFGFDDNGAAHVIGASEINGRMLNMATPSAVMDTLQAEGVTPWTVLNNPASLPTDFSKPLPVPVNFLSPPDRIGADDSVLVWDPATDRYGSPTTSTPPPPQPKTSYDYYDDAIDEYDKAQDAFYDARDAAIDAWNKEQNAFYDAQDAAIDAWWAQFAQVMGGGGHVLINATPPGMPPFPELKTFDVLFPDMSGFTAPFPPSPMNVKDDYTTALDEWQKAFEAWTPDTTDLFNEPPPFEDDPLLMDLTFGEEAALTIEFPNLTIAELTQFAEQFPTFTRSDLTNLLDGVSESFPNLNLSDLTNSAPVSITVTNAPLTGFAIGPVSTPVDITITGDSPLDQFIDELVGGLNAGLAERGQGPVSQGFVNLLEQQSDPKWVAYFVALDAAQHGLDTVKKPDSGYVPDVTVNSADKQMADQLIQMINGSYQKGGGDVEGPGYDLVDLSGLPGIAQSGLPVGDVKFVW